MNGLDVAWSDSHQQWVIREPRLRWVGDIIASRAVDKDYAHQVVPFANEQKLGKECSWDEILKRFRESR